MTRPLEITEVRFTAARPDLQRSGMLGWLSCVLGGVLRVDGISLRRTADRRLALSFPARKDRHGVLHPTVQPFDDATGKEIERQVFALLRGEEVER